MLEAADIEQGQAGDAQQQGGQGAQQDAVLIHRQTQDQHHDNGGEQHRQPDVQPGRELHPLLLVGLFDDLLGHGIAGVAGVIAVFLLLVYVFVGVAPGLAAGFLLVGVLVDAGPVTVFGHGSFSSCHLIREIAAQQVQRVVGGEGADALPIAAQRQLPHENALRRGKGCEHGAHGVAVVVACGAGQSGDGQGQIRAGKDADTHGHGAGHGGGHGAIRLQQGGGDAQHVLLHGVGVADHAAQKRLGCDIL